MFESAVSGLITGSAGALIGLCLVLTYRTAGVINFAQAAFGTFGAFTMLQLYDAGWAYVPAAIVGLATGAVLAVLLGLVMLRFFPEASVDTKTGVTIGILVTMLTAGLLIFGNDPHQFPAVLPNVSVTIGGVVVPGRRSPASPRRRAGRRAHRLPERDAEGDADPCRRVAPRDRRGARHPGPGAHDRDLGRGRDDHRRRDAHHRALAGRPVLPDVAPDPVRPGGGAVRAVPLAAGHRRWAVS